MNRVKEVEICKELQEMRNLSKEETKLYLITKDKRNALFRLTREFHAKLFPEEYDHMFDSHSDAIARRSGHNPMKDEYTQTRNGLRIELGFYPLCEAPNTQSTHDWVYKELKAGRRENLLRILRRRGEPD